MGTANGVAKPNRRSSPTPTPAKVDARIPPHDLGAEAIVLSECLTNPDGFARVTDILVPSNFYSDANRRVYEAITAIAQSDRDVDHVAVAGWLRDRERLAQVGHAAYLIQLSNDVPAVANVEEHAQRIVNLARTRELIATAQKIAAEGYGVRGDDVERYLDESEREITRIRTGADAGAELVTLGALVGPALERAELRRSGEERPVPIQFAELAAALGGGFWPGAHQIVSGTGVGKSQLSIQIATNAAEHGVPTLYIGLELDEYQIAIRSLAARAGVEWSRLYLGRYSDQTLTRVRGAADEIKGLPFYADFGSPRGWPPSLLLKRLKSLRRLYPKGPLLVVLDYLQLVGEEDRGDAPRSPELRERIGGAAYAAHEASRRYGAAIVIVSSAARAHYNLLAGDVQNAGLVVASGKYGPEKRIISPDILVGLGKESGELEFSASSVTTLIRWPARLPGGDSVILCATPKVRWGAPTWCALSFSGTRFEPLTIEAMDDLPEVAPRRKSGKGRPSVDSDDMVARIVATLTRIGPTKSKRQIVSQTEGEDRKLYAAINSAMVSRKIVVDADGKMTAALAAADAGGTQQ